MNIRFALGKKMEKLPETTLATVTLSILVMNPDKIISSILQCLYSVMSSWLN